MDTRPAPVLSIHRELPLPGHKETAILTDVVRLPDQDPFVCLTITGPENALCLRLNKGTLKILRKQLDHLQEQLRR